MKKFVGLILILASVLLSSVSNLHAGSYDSYLAIIGKSGKPRPDQKLAAINQLITNGADQNNNVILDLLANKILDLKYHELIKLDLSAKLAQILNKLPELSSASDSSSAPTVASSSPASFSGAPSLPSSSGGSALDKYVSEPKDNDALFLILTNAEDLLNVVIVDYLINRLKLKNYSDLIKMRLYEKEKLLIDSLTSIFAPGAGADEVTSPVTGIASYTEPEAEAAGSYHGTYYSVGDTVVNPMAGLNKTQATTITPSTSPMFTGAGTGAGTGVSTSPVAPTGKPAGGPAFLSGLTGNPMAGLKKTGIPTQTASTGSSVPAGTSAGLLKPAVTSAFGKPSIVATTDTGTGPGMAGAGSGTGAGAGAGTSLTGAGVEPGPNARIILNIVKDLTPSEQSALLSYPDTQLSNVVNRIDTSLGGTASGGFTKPFMIKGSLTSAGFFEPYTPTTKPNSSTTTKPKPAVKRTTKTTDPVSTGPKKPTVIDISRLAGLPKYEALLAQGKQDQEILFSLLAPSSAVWASNPAQMLADINRIPNDTTGMIDINNHEILDFLLQRKFNQQPSTTEQMNIADKIVDVVRRLANDPTLTMTLPKVAGRRSWIEFPQPGARTEVDIMNCATRKLEKQSRSRRHLDYNISGDRTVYLLNRHIFDCSYGPSDKFNSGYHVGDHMVIRSYYPPMGTTITNYYWTQDGERFLLVYSDGSSQLFEWEHGEPVGEPIPAAAPVQATRAGRDKHDKPVQVTGETQEHFFARRIATLDTSHGSIDRSKGSDFIAAMAIQALDSVTFNELDNSMVATLKNPEEFIDKIPALLLKEVSATNILEKAKIYTAIHSGNISVDDPNYTRWKEALDQIELDALKEGSGSGLSPSEAFGRTISKFSLDDTQMSRLRTPSTFSALIPAILLKDLASTETLEQAQVYYAIIAGMVNSSDPNVNKWKSLLGII